MMFSFSECLTIMWKVFREYIFGIYLLSTLYKLPRLDSVRVEINYYPVLLNLYPHIMHLNTRCSTEGAFIPMVNITVLE